MNLKDILKLPKYVISPLFINQAIKLELNLNEFIILVYFDNLIDKTFDIKALTNTLNLKDSDALTSFNMLIERKLISIDTEKNPAGKLVEKVNLDSFYALLAEESSEIVKVKKQADIYSIFEKEFGRPISSMEYEIINSWLDKNFSEEMVIGALKEAIYNGVTNLRYIDKILYEWQRKGFKNMKDVEKHLKNRSKKDDQTEKVLFDYNWLDDDSD